MFETEEKAKQFDRKRVIIISEKLKNSGMEKIIFFLQGIGMVVKTIDKSLKKY